MRKTVVAATGELHPALLVSLRHMLEAAFDDPEEGGLTDEDWGHTVGGVHVIVLDGDAPVAHAAVVERLIEVAGVPFRTGYVEAVATVEDQRRHGLGSAVMGEAAAIIRDGFAMGALATGIPDFYARLGWELWQGPTSARYGDIEVRTPDEDDAVMVLRFGPSAGVDLASPISCPSRPGDDW